MSYYEEFSFCPIQEYEAWEQYRMPAEDILVDEKYIVMMYLSQQINKHRSIKVPTRVRELERSSDNVQIVRFSLDMPGLPATPWHIESEIRDGYMGALNTTKGRQFKFNGVTARRSYFRGQLGPGSGPDDELRNLLDIELGALV